MSLPRSIPRVHRAPARPGRAFIASLCVASVLLLGPIPVLAQDEAASARVQSLEVQLEAIRAEMQALRAEMEAMKAADTAEAQAARAAEVTEAAEEAGTASPLDERIERIESQIDILAQEIERQKIGADVFRPAEKSEHGLGVAASKVYQVDQGLSIGGYGEAIYNGFASERDDGTPTGAVDQADFLRAIVYFGYKFDDRWVFNSEIEFEHASTDKSGSASVEFAYLDYLYKPELNLRFGLVLVPMGFVNELHEPTQFLGARRPDIESAIIPSTWRENGFGVFGDVGGFSYRSYVVNGLDGAKFSSSGLRGGRQKGSKAKADDLAWVGRLDYSRPGFLVGASAYLGDSGQDLTDASGRGIDVGTSIFEAHLEYRARGFALRLLGVHAELDDVARLNEALGYSGASSVGETLEGWYAQVGYDLFAHRGGTASLTPYARYETYDTQSDVPAGYAAHPARSVESLTLGIAFQPIDPLIFKLDFQNYDNDAGTGVDQVNAAIGYIF